MKKLLLAGLLLWAINAQAATVSCPQTLSCTSNVCTFSVPDARWDWVVVPQPLFSPFDIQDGTYTFIAASVPETYRNNQSPQGFGAFCAYVPEGAVTDFDKIVSLQISGHPTNAADYLTATPASNWEFGEAGSFFLNCVNNTATNCAFTIVSWAT